jgi:hypothetical protein
VGDTGRTGWKAGIEVVVAVKRLDAVLEAVASVVAGRSQDCMAEEDRRRVDREECFVEVDQAAVACSAAAQERPWVA